MLVRGGLRQELLHFLVTMSVSDLVAPVVAPAQR
jgi:hypothetical protein